MVNESSCTIELWMHLGDVFERTANKLTTTWGIVYWRHQRAQWEYVARSCFLKTHWIWLGQYSSYVIMYIWWCSYSIDMWMDTFLLRKKGEDEVPAFWIARIFCSFIYSFIFIFSWMDFVFYTMLRSLNVSWYFFPWTNVLDTWENWNMI